MSFNLTEWALRHRSLTQFFLILLTAAGLLSYATLGLKEEPEFKFQTLLGPGSLSDTKAVPRLVPELLRKSACTCPTSVSFK